MPHKNGSVPIIRLATRMIGSVGIGLLLANVFLQMFDIACRWLLSMPQSWVADVYEVTLPVAIAACFPLTVAHRGMIAIEFLGKGLGGVAHRALNLLGAVALLAVLGIITWQMLVYSNEAAATGRASFLLHIPLAPTWYLATLCFALGTVVQGVVTLTSGAEQGETETMEGI